MLCPYADVIDIFLISDRLKLNVLNGDRGDRTGLIK
jgi:hypothetical protein